MATHNAMTPNAFANNTPSGVRCETSSAPSLTIQHSSYGMRFDLDPKRDASLISMFCFCQWVVRIHCADANANSDIHAESHA